MTDGPFKNPALGRRWKQYGDDLVNDATSQDERTARACHSMLGDVDVQAFSSLFDALRAHSLSPQMDLPPISSIDDIFDRYPKTPLADILQKQLTANLRDQMPEGIALAVSFQQVVHSVPSREADVAEASLPWRGTEWTSTRMRA